MPFQLVLKEPPTENAKSVGENIFFENLPFDYKVYALYYPAAMPDEALEAKLRALGAITGGNLLVNIGRLDDPQLDKIASLFQVKSYSVIIVTAVDALASAGAHYLSAYARLDSKHFLDSPDRVVDCVQRLFNLFIQGKVSDAIAKAKWSQRQELVAWVANVFTNALKSLGGFIAARDISVSLYEGKFELKQH